MVTSYTATFRDTAVTPKVGEVNSDAWEPFLVNNVPTGRYHVLESTEDGQITSGIWQHKVQDSPDGQFLFKQTVEEVFFVIAGEATLTFPDNTTIHLSAGNSFYFPLGSEVFWRTSKDFTKFFVLY